MKRAVHDGWVMGGSRDPRGQQVFGFSEQDVAVAAVGSFYAALVAVPCGDRTQALRQLQEEFGAALGELAS